MKMILERVRGLLASNPRAVRFAAILAVLVAAGVPLARLVPRSTTVDFDLGADHAQVTALRIAYLPVGQDATRAITLRFPNGAPEHVEHAVELAPGRYEVHARVILRDGEYETTAYLDVPLRDDASIPLHRRSIFDIGGTP